MDSGALRFRSLDLLQHRFAVAHCGGALGLHRIALGLPIGLFSLPLPPPLLLLNSHFVEQTSLLVELAAYRFEPPHGHTHADVLLEAHRIRTERGDYNIAPEHLADAIEILVERTQASLSDDRSPKNPY